VNIKINESYDDLLASDEEHLNPSREETMPSDASSHWPWSEADLTMKNGDLSMKNMLILPCLNINNGDFCKHEKIGDSTIKNWGLPSKMRI
jgi:hypothetical protein